MAGMCALLQHVTLRIVACCPVCFAVSPHLLPLYTGVCEATAQLLMMTGAAHLPGALLPLLMQTVLLWNVVFSSIIFGTR